MSRIARLLGGWCVIAYATLIALSTAFADTETGTDYDYKYNLDDSERITVDDLQATIKTQKLTTVEDVIKILPLHLRDRYVLMYRSKSLQDASPLAPRAILYGEKADLVISFNGDPGQRGYNALEIMQYRANTQSFEFFEIVFNEDQTVNFSEANPQKCMACHQSSSRENIDPRPNWEAYNLWPGAYGSMDGYIRRNISKDKYFTDRLSPEDKVYIEEQAAEKKHIKVFERKIKPNHPRYKYLTEYDATSPKYFNEFLGRKNFDRIVRLMRETPQYQYFKYALAAKSTTECEIKKPFINEQQLKYLGADALDLQWDYDKELTVSSLIHLLFTAQGVDTSDWSMNFRSSGRFAVREEFGLPYSPWVHLYYSLERVEPELTHRGNCRQLAKMHNDAFQTLIQNHPQRPLTWDTGTNESEHGILNACANCHTSGRVDIPQIPFDDPGSLKAALSKSGYANGSLKDEILFRINYHTPGKLQMPPTGNFKLADKEKLVQYLKQL